MMPASSELAVVVSFSGGVASWAAAARAVARYGPDAVTLLFADTMIEDEDTYRFIPEAAAVLGVEVTRIADGRNPWQVFRDRRFIGNTRADPCSAILKRELLRKWIDDRHPDGCLVVVGIDWTETHRVATIRDNHEPHRVWFPLIDDEVDKMQTFDELAAAGIEPPRRYTQGFPHNNCGGFCVKAGMAQFAKLLEHDPELFAWHEAEEEETRQYLNADVAILRDRRRSVRELRARALDLEEVPGAVPLTLRQFREQVQSGERVVDVHDWGGCGCALPGDDQPSQLSLDLGAIPVKVRRS